MKKTITLACPHCNEVMKISRKGDSMRGVCGHCTTNVNIFYEGFKAKEIQVDDLHLNLLKDLDKEQYPENYLTKEEIYLLVTLRHPDDDLVTKFLTIFNRVNKIESNRYFLSYDFFLKVMDYLKSANSPVGIETDIEFFQTYVQAFCPHQKAELYQLPENYITDEDMVDTMQCSNPQIATEQTIEEAFAEVKMDIELLIAAKRILSGVQYVPNIGNALDGCLHDLYQLDDMFSQMEIENNMKTNSKTAFICVGDGKPETALNVNLNNLHYVRTGGHKHENGDITHRIEMYFESQNTLLIIEDGIATTYSEIVNDRGIWTSDSEDRLFSTAELFILK